MLLQLGAADPLDLASLETLLRCACCDGVRAIIASSAAYLCAKAAWCLELHLVDELLDVSFRQAKASRERPLALPYWRPQYKYWVGAPFPTEMRHPGVLRAKQRFAACAAKFCGLRRARSGCFAPQWMPWRAAPSRTARQGA